MSSVPVSRETETPHGQAPPPRLPRTFWLVIVVLVCVLAGAIAYDVTVGISARVHAAGALEKLTLDMAIPTVEVVHPKLNGTAEELVLPGNIQGYIASPVYARTNGYLKKWYFDIGTHVKAGQLLAEIETPELDRQLEQARADLATTKANVVTTQANWATAQANMDTAKANHDLSATTAERYQNLFKSDSVAKQDVDNRVGDLLARKAMVESAKAMVESAKATVDTAKASVESSISNVRRLEELQRFQKIYAPFDGVITARNTDIGALIDAANATGKQLFDITATHELRVYVNVPQVYSGEIHPGGTADLTLEQFPGRTFAGKIARTSGAIDPASRTLLTEVDLDNSAGELFPGAFVSVHLKLAPRAGAVIVPVETLIFRSAGIQVGVVRDNKAELVPITIGRDYGTRVEVISGITPEDSVISNPSDSLASGAEVRVATAPETKAPATKASGK